jgi:putative membrane protein
VTADPFMLLALVFASGAYAAGTVRIWQRVGRGRVVRRGHVAAWSVAMVALAVAFSGPVETLAAASLSGHMIQHMILSLVAAPLLAVAGPVLPMLQGLPHRLRRPAARAHARARPLRRITEGGLWVVGVVGLYAASAWLWHLPGPYQLAMRNDLVHALEHATMLGAATLLWWTIAQSGRRSAFGYGTGIAVVFVAALQHASLGAVLSLAPSALYPAYKSAAGIGTFTVLEDQQFAGVIMAAPSKLLHGVVVAVLVVAWLRASEERARRRETPSEVSS